MENKKEIIEKIRHIPPLSQSTEQLVKLMGDPEHDISHVVRIVESDAALTTKVLTVVNSAAFSLQEPIATVYRAISYLGGKTVLGIALDFCTNGLYQKPLEGYESKQGALWEHNLRTAIASKEIARFSKIETSADLAFTGGLLHDIGKAILSEFLKDTAEAFISGIDHGLVTDYLAAEEAKLDTNHCVVGAGLAKAWGLPEPLPEIIKCHHHPREADVSIQGLVYTVHLGDVVAMTGGADTGSDNLQYHLDKQYQDFIDISSDDLSLIVLKVDEEIGRTKSFLFGAKEEA